MCYPFLTFFVGLAIPYTEYSATISLPSTEFQRIIRDLAVIGDTGIDWNHIGEPLTLILF